MLALGVHSLFEGIALGLMSNKESLINLAISILIHKWAESMSISISLIKSFDQFSTIFKLMLLYSFITPVGTIIGIVLGDAPIIIQIVFMSLACGTFLYVSCSELIVEEFSLPGNRWLKMLGFCIGAALVGLLLLLD